LLSFKVNRGRLFEQVAQQLQELIVSNQTLRPGDRLPSERQLAEQLGVSRTVVREAVKVLEQAGLVAVVTGSGTYVSQVRPKTVSESITLLVRQRGSSFEHLFEVRRILEVEIAGLAALRAKPDDLDVLKQLLREAEAAAENMRDHPDRLNVLVEADLAFHNALAQATQNSLLPTLLDAISDPLMELRRVATRAAPEALDAGPHYHRLILERVAAGDVTGSREVMRQHLAAAEAYVSMAKGAEEGQGQHPS